MHGVLLLAIFGFCVASRVGPRGHRPPCCRVVAGAGWPATLYPTEASRTAR